MWGQKGVSLNKLTVCTHDDDDDYDFDYDYDDGYDNGEFEHKSWENGTVYTV